MHNPFDSALDSHQRLQPESSSISASNLAGQKVSWLQTLISKKGGLDVGIAVNPVVVDADLEVLSSSKVFLDHF